MPPGSTVCLSNLAPLHKEHSVLSASYLFYVKSFDSRGKAKIFNNFDHLLILSHQAEFTSLGFDHLEFDLFVDSLEDFCLSDMFLQLVDIISFKRFFGLSSRIFRFDMETCSRGRLSWRWRWRKREKRSSGSQKWPENHIEKQLKEIHIS